MGQFMQDAEFMLRLVLQAVFNEHGPEKVRGLLEAMQADQEFLSRELNNELLEWAEAQGGKTQRESMNALLVSRRKAFRAANTVWAKVNHMMDGDRKSEGGEPGGAYLRCVEYLTFNELRCDLS